MYSYVYTPLGIILRNFRTQSSKYRIIYNGSSFNGMGIVFK